MSKRFVMDARLCHSELQRVVPVDQRAGKCGAWVHGCHAIGVQYPSRIQRCTPTRPPPQGST